MFFQTILTGSRGIHKDSSNSYKGIFKSAFKPNYSTSIVGSGLMGLLFIMMLRSLGTS